MKPIKTRPPQSGRFPKPVKLEPLTTAWRVEDIRAHIQTGSRG